MLLGIFCACGSVKYTHWASLHIPYLTAIVDLVLDLQNL